MIKKESSYSLLQHNTFGIDVKTAKFVEFDSTEELVAVIKGGIGEPHFVIGAGSNLLFMNDYKGTILHSNITDISVVGETEEQIFVRVGSGVVLDDFIAYSVSQGWQGLENLSAIPGEVGASAVQNVGAYGVEAGDFIVKVEAVELDAACECTFTKEDCSFSYRNSIFKTLQKNRCVITHVTYGLRKASHAEYNLKYGNLRASVEALGELSAANIREAVISIRAQKLPDTALLGSAGSFFMNPVVDCDKAASLLALYSDMPQYDTAEGKKKLSAAWLIDQCGWKEKRMGCVGVYHCQPLVIVNHGGANGKDIYDYSQLIVDSVKERFGVELVREVNVIE